MHNRHTLTDEQRFFLIGMIEERLTQYRTFYQKNHNEDLRDTWSQRVSLLEGILTFLKHYE